MQKLLRFESLCIDKSLKQDVFMHLSLEIKTYTVLKGKACLYLE